MFLSRKVQDYGVGERDSSSAQNATSRDILQIYGSDLGPSSAGGPQDPYLQGLGDLMSDLRLLMLGMHPSPLGLSRSK